MKKLKFSLWNINGLRSILKKPYLENYIHSTEPDFLCFNEIRIDSKSLQNLILPTYLNEKYPNKIWNSAQKKGYSGVAVLTKHNPINVFYNFNFLKIEHDEGRILTLEYEEFFLVCLYSPMSGRQLDRLDERINKWEVEVQDHVQKLKGILFIIYFY